jgi:hypothetical protein
MFSLFAIYSTILEKIIHPLTYAWNHPTMIDELKPRLFLFKPEVCCHPYNVHFLKSTSQSYPALYNWTTFPLTCLIERLWHHGCVTAKEDRYPGSTTVELCSAAERALNFMHTGNVSVIATSAMNPLWIGLSIIHDGHPCINPHIVPTLTSYPFVNRSRWPFNNKGQPTSASRGAQLRTYGQRHFNVCHAFFPKSISCTRMTCFKWSDRQSRTRSTLSMMSKTKGPTKSNAFDFVDEPKNAVTDKVERVRLCRLCQKQRDRQSRMRSTLSVI